VALIQILALDEDSHRRDEGLTEELQGPPKSSSSWRDLALEHPEFFRVRRDGLRGVALVARHVLPQEGEKRRPLPLEFTGHLLQAAIELHDRQIRRNDRWTYLIPIWVALIAGIFSLVVAFAGKTKTEPNQALLPTPTAVTPAATHPSRQP